MSIDERVASRHCPACGVEITQRPNEGPKRFAKRRTCSAACGQLKTGQSRSAEYGVWHSMRERCERVSNEHYAKYGGRGIHVCARWKEFVNFISDMGHRPSEHYTLDRIDNNGNYEPSNCRWATRREQQNNRRVNVPVTVGGLTLTATEWDRAKGYREGTILARLANGWPHDAAVLTPPRLGNRPKNWVSE